MIDQYVIDCIKNSKKPSGRLLAGHTIEYEKLYCKALNITPPSCVVCNKQTSFISIKKGFRKFCSKQCYNVDLSDRNREENKLRNKNTAKALHEKRIFEYGSILEQCVADYQHSNVTVKELAEKYNIELYFLQRYFRNNKLTTKRVQQLRYQQYLLETCGFKNINNQLEDEQWVMAKLKEGWTCRNFAEELKCSVNYVVCFLKKTYPDIVFKNASSYEVELVNFIKELNIQPLLHSRKIISPKEIDIFIPEHNVGIEINGVYWHSKERVGKFYHSDKTDACVNAGVRLLHFTDREIEFKQQHVHSIIRSSVNACTKIFARKCRVVQLTSQQYRNFCTDNHIQGFAAATVKLGLEYHGDIVAIMSFAKPRFNKNFEYELIRYCCLLNHTVVGGPNKLFHYFTNNYPCNSIITYCQRRLFTGNMYTNLKMKYIRTTPPNYVWVDQHNEVLTRYQTQKHRLQDDKSLTESQIMTNKGYHQIFDSGQNVYVWYK